MNNKAKGKRLKINKAKLRPLEPASDAFLALSRSIIYQQISTKAGNSIFGRYLALFRQKSPTPKALLALSDATLRGAGLSGQKVRYMRDLAAKFLDKTIDPSKFSTMSDEEIIEHLTEVKGIGEWTAHMFLIFALNRPNILPVGDLAIKKGFKKAFGLRNLPSDKRMRELARPHQGAHTELALHLWRIMDEESGTDWE